MGLGLKHWRTRRVFLMPLTDLIPAGPSGPGRPARENLEAWLLPLVRRAIRSRSGLPGLTNWVQQTLVALEGAPPPDAELAAPGLTRILCDTLLRQQDAADRPVTETVCGL
jgi:hypothetical protein